MAQRRFGPTLDAGVVIIEKESEKTVTPSALGSTGYVGVLERGEVGELILCSGKRDMEAKVGTYIPDSVLPDNCRDFWSLGEGAGILALQRVTDGEEAMATLTLRDRKVARNAVITLTAKNGGGWGGRGQTWVVDLTAVPASIISETEVDIPAAFEMKKDEMKGGTIGLKGITPATYNITANNAFDDAVNPGRVTVESDDLMLTDFGAGADDEVTLIVGETDIWARSRQLSVIVKDGQRYPSTEWGLEVYLHDELVRAWPDLSSDPNSERYFVDLINDDGGNHYIEVTNLWGGSITASIRPANHYGAVASATEIAEKVLSIDSVALVVDDSLAGTNTLAALTFGSEVIPDVYELEYTAAWALVSLGQQINHVFPVPVTAVIYPPDNDYSIGFTVTEVAPIAGEKFTITVLPLAEDEAINGRIYFPDEATAPSNGWTITDNDEMTATITTGDLTIGGTIAGTVNYRLEYKQHLGFGYDGIAGADVNDYLALWDPITSKFLEVVNKGYGLIKFVTPGVTDQLGSADATLVEKAGYAYAEAQNHQYRPEIPKATTDEFVARTHVQDTLGRSDFSKVIFPSYAYVADPILQGRLKQIPVTGMLHGREAKTAQNYNGYHKVAAGLEVTLPRIVKLPTGDVVLNGELLNSAGIQRIEKRAGNFVVWGAQIPSLDSAFKFCQHRELLSYYEHVLQESFDYIIFAINDSAEWPGLIAALKSFFMPEWRKRALRGDTFEDAAAIKIDAENNTDATMAVGDLNAEIKLRLADTVERFIITVSKIGVHEELSL